MKQSSLVLSFLWVLIPALQYPLSISAQQTLKDTDPYHLYEEGRMLMDRNRHASAQERFEQYIRQSENTAYLPGAKYYRAMTAMELFQDDTETLFRELIDQYPEHNKTRLAYFQLGKYHFRNEDQMQALRWLAKADPHILSDDDWAEYHFMAGYAAFDAGEHDSATSHFDNISDYQNPFRDDALYYKAYIAQSAGKPETALALFSKLDEESRYDSIVPVFISRLMVKLKRFEDAVVYAESIPESRSVSRKHKMDRSLGQAYFFLEDYPKAIRHFKAASGDAAPLSDEEHYFFGFSYFKEGKMEAAVEQFEAMNIREDSVGQNASFHMGQALFDSGDKIRARNAFEFASGLDYNEEITQKAAYNFGVISYQLEFQKEAIEAFRNLAERFPGTELAGKAQAQLGEILLATRNYQQALTIIEELPERTPEMNKAYQQIAYYFAFNNYKNRSYDRARTYFRKVINNPADDQFTAKAHFWLGEMLYMNEAFREAEQHFRSFASFPEARETPYFILYHYNLGYSYFHREQYERASEHFDLFIENARRENLHEEKIADARLRQADASFGQRDFQRATEQYNRSIREYSYQVDYALFQLARIAGLRGKYEQQLEYLADLRDNHPESAYLQDALFEIAEVHFKTGRDNTALNNFRYIIQEYPDGPYHRLSQLKIGLIRYNQEQDEDALEILKSLIREAPYSGESREALNIIRNIYIEQGKEERLFAFIEEIPDVELTASFQDSITYESALNAWHGRNYTQSAKGFEQYLNDFPEGYFRLNAHYYLAESAYQLQDYPTALEHFKKVSELGASQFEERSLKRASALLESTMRYDEAYDFYSSFHRAASSQKNRVEAKKGQIRMAYQLYRYNQTIDHINELRAMSDLDEEARTFAAYYAGMSFYELGSFDNAKHELTKVFEVDPGERGANAKYTTAEILYKEGRNKEAQEMIYDLREAYIIYEHYVAKGFILLGDIFMAKGNLFQAKHTLQSVIDNHDDEQLVSIAREKLEAVRKKEEERSSK